MRQTIQRKLGSQRAVQDVCDEYRDTIQATDGGRKAYAKLNSSIDSVDRLSSEQQQALNARRVASADCRQRRQTIHDLIKSIVEVSAVVTLSEGSAKIVRMPEMGTNESLLAEANAIYEMASANAAAFVDEGLPKNVIPDLGTQITAFKAARARLSNARKTFAAVTKAAIASLRSGHEGIAVIDAILAHTPSADPKALTKLRLAKRIGPARPVVPVAAEPPAAKADPASTTSTKVA